MVCSGVSIGFALQSVLKDLFASFTLVFEEVCWGGAEWGAGCFQTPKHLETWHCGGSPSIFLFFWSTAFANTANLRTCHVITAVFACSGSTSGPKSRFRVGRASSSTWASGRRRSGSSRWVGWWALHPADCQHDFIQIKVDVDYV